MRVSLWRPIVGSGRAVAIANGSNTTDTVAMGTQTYACLVSATGSNCMITLQHGGVAATATTDILLKTTDPPLLLACAPGDKISTYGLTTTGNVYVTEMTH